MTVVLPSSGKNSIDHLVNDITCENERIKYIELSLSCPLLIICVYMSCNGEKDNYQLFTKTIEQLKEIIYTYKKSHDIIIGGDFNENVLLRNSSKRSEYLHKFIEGNELSTKVTDHIFIHPNGKDVSTIDFFLFKTHMTDNVLLITRKNDYHGNISDHYPVSLKLRTTIAKKKN